MAHQGKIRELVNWTEARALMDFEPPNPSLIVHGDLPYPMDVTLEPRPEVVDEPEFWPVEVVGYHDTGVEEVITTYEVQVSLAKLPKGTKGIELIGNEQTEDIELPS
jgi:hypothetical protein